MPTKWYQRTEGDRVSPQRRLPLPQWGCLVGVLALVIVLTAGWWLPAMSRVLVVDQSPVPSSAILVLGGGNGERENRALALYERGLAPMIITSGEKPLLPGQELTFAEISADYLYAHGVAREAILMMKETTSTHEEAAQSLEMAQARGFSSLLVVTDAYHTGRASLAFRKVYRNTGIRLTFVAEYPAWYQMDSWWTQERSFLAVCEEYMKLAFYLVKGYIL